MDKYPVGHPERPDIMDLDADVAPLVPLAGHPELPAAAVGPEPEEDPIPIVGDPYYPVAPVDSSEEEDPSEDEPEYHVAEHFGSDNDNEGILEDIPFDDAQPIECLSEEEVNISPSPAAIPYYQPYLREGKGPWMMTTPGTGAQPDMYSFVDRVIDDHAQKRKAPEGSAHYEIGESSQAPPPAPPPAVCTCQAQIEVLTRRIQTLEDHNRSLYAASRTTVRRVEALEEEERQDTEAISTLYHRHHATRTDVINLQMRSGHLETSEGTTQAHLSAAERTVTELRGENRQLREQIDELFRYLVARFGR